MRFWEAMRELEEGKRIRCASWKEDSWISKGDCVGCKEASFFAQWTENLRRAEWELYCEPVKTCKLWELIPALKEGKKIRRIAWPENYANYLECIDSDIRSFWGNCWHLYSPSMEDFMADDWVMCE